MLERRNPEDYGKRSPNTFTADQVVSLLASVCSGAVKTVNPDQIEEFYGYFDDAFDEVEAKHGTPLVPRNAAAADSKTPPKQPKEQPIHAASRNGHSHNGTAPSTNGHHPPSAPPAAESAMVAPEPPASPPVAASVSWPSEPVSNGNGAEDLSSESATHANADQSGSFSNEYEVDAFADEDFDTELGDDDSDELNGIDWDRIEELHNAECRYVSAKVVPDPVERIAANRAVRLTLAAARLRGQIKPDLMHHPLNRLDKTMDTDVSRNTLPDMDLRQHHKSCTNTENTKGRCMNGAETADCDAVPAAAAGTVSG